MKAFCDLAAGVAQASKCERAKHGCVLTTMDLQVISYGYNGVARGLPDGCLRGVQGNCGCVHAEANSIAKAGNASLDKIAFITCQPCERCASLLVNNGVRMVVQKFGHRAYPDGILILDRLGIPYGDINEMADLLRECHRAESIRTRENDFNSFHKADFGKDFAKNPNESKKGSTIRSAFSTVLQRRNNAVNDDGANSTS